MKELTTALLILFGFVIVSLPGSTQDAITDPDAGPDHVSVTLANGVTQLVGQARVSQEMLLEKVDSFNSVLLPSHDPEALVRLEKLAIAELDETH